MKKNIICYICRERVGYIDVDECQIPLRGSMIHRHPGCDHWPMPLENDSALKFVCPHAIEDHHLFVPFRESEHEEASQFMGEDHKLFRVGHFIGDCPCGCGEPVREGNKYADNLKCYRRDVAKLKSEIESNGNGEGKEDS
jgi:hypothetical protein